MKLTLSSSGTDACSFIQTEGHDVFITEAYVGPTLISNDGEILSICLRDRGFEVTYLDDDDVEHVYSFVDGFVRRVSLKGRSSETNVVPLKSRQ